MEVVIDSTKDAGGSFKALPHLSELPSLPVRSPKAAVSLNGAAAGEWPHQPRPRWLHGSLGDPATLGRL